MDTFAGAGTAKRKLPMQCQVHSWLAIMQVPLGAAIGMCIGTCGACKGLCLAF